MYRHVSQETTGITLSCTGMLLWFFQDELVLQRTCESDEGIKEAEVEINKENILDDVVDADIAMLEKFFAKDVWRAVQHAGKLIRNQG